MPEKRANRAQKEPDGRKNPIERMGDRKGLSIAYNANHLSADLVRAERSFDFRLVISDEIEPI